MKNRGKEAQRKKKHVCGFIVARGSTFLLLRRMVFIIGSVPNDDDDDDDVDIDNSDDGDDGDDGDNDDHDVQNTA